MPGVSQVGRLRNKVTFKTTTISADTFGGYTKANNSYFDAFAEIKPKVAQDRVQGDQQVSPQRFEVIIRYRGDKTALDTSYTMTCLLYTSPSPRDRTRSRMPSSA